jgi:choline kinase
LISHSKETFVRSIILGAGEGQRLRPYTADRPKCLVELDGRSMLQRGIDVHHALGIHDIVVVTGYRADAVERLGLRTAFNPRFASTNMVQSLMSAAEYLDGTTDVVIAYADIVYEPRVLRALAVSEAPIALAVNTSWLALWRLRMEDPLSDAETLKLDASGHVIELGKKPTSYADVQGQYMGLMKFSAAEARRIPAVFDALDPRGPYDGKNRANMYMTSFLQHWIDHVSPITAVPVDGGWIEVDTAADLESYNQMQREGRLQEFCRLG